MQATDSDLVGGSLVGSCRISFGEWTTVRWFRPIQYVKDSEVAFRSQWRDTKPFHKYGSSLFKFRIEIEVEIDSDCQSTLRSRMQEGNLPVAPIASDVGEYWPSTPEALAAPALVAGFPCQA